MPLGISRQMHVNYLRIQFVQSTSSLSTCKKCRQCFHLSPQTPLYVGLSTGQSLINWALLMHICCTACRRNQLHVLFTIALAQSSHHFVSCILHCLQTNNFSFFVRKRCNILTQLYFEYNSSLVVPKEALLSWGNQVPADCKSKPLWFIQSFITEQVATPTQCSCSWLW